MIILLSALLSISAGAQTCIPSDNASRQFMTTPNATSGPVLCLFTSEHNTRALSCCNSRNEDVADLTGAMACSPTAFVGKQSRFYFNCKARGKIALPGSVCLPGKKLGAGQCR